MNFLDFIKLIPKGIQNAPKIIEGMANVIRMENNSLPEEEVEEILRRRLICAACPEMSKNKEIKTSREDPFCVLCSCPIKGKTASLSSTCGAEYYNTLHPEDPKEIKWQKYDNPNKSGGSTENPT